MKLARNFTSERLKQNPVRRKNLLTGFFFCAYNGFTMIEATIDVYCDVPTKEQSELREQFEEKTGLKFDYNGPDVCICEYCNEAFQFIPDHECWGIDAESADAKHYEEMAY